MIGKIILTATTIIAAGTAVYFYKKCGKTPNNSPNQNPKKGNSFAPDAPKALTQQEADALAAQITKSLSDEILIKPIKGVIPQSASLINQLKQGGFMYNKDGTATPIPPPQPDAPVVPKNITPKTNSTTPNNSNNLNNAAPFAPHNQPSNVPSMPKGGKKSLI